MGERIIGTLPMKFMEDAAGEPSLRPHPALNDTNAPHAVRSSEEPGVQGYLAHKEPPPPPKGFYKALSIVPQ